MDIHDLIILNKIAIKKFQDNPNFEEQIKNMKETNEKLALIKNKQVSKAREKVIIENFKKLGIDFIPITADISLTSY